MCRPVKSEPASRPWAGHHSIASAVRASIGARLRSGFNPGPAGGATLFAVPRFPREDARRRWSVEVPFCASHFPSAGVARHFDGIRRAFAVRACGPGTRQLPMLVTMFGAGLHPLLMLSQGRTSHPSWMPSRSWLPPNRRNSRGVTACRSIVSRSAPRLVSPRSRKPACARVRA